MGIVALGLAVCSAPSFAADAFTFTPIVQYTKRPANASLYHNQISRGTFTFDQYFRPVSEDGAPLLVSCDSTESLGVTLIGKNPRKFKTRTIGVTYSWWHSATGNRAPHGKYPRTHIFATGVRTRVFSEYYDLKASDRVDGIISVDAMVGPEKVLSVSFQLVGCGTNRH